MYKDKNSGLSLGQMLQFWGGKAKAWGGACVDSTNIDQSTCTSSYGHDFTSSYNMYIPLPENIHITIN